MPPMKVNPDEPSTELTIANDELEPDFTDLPLESTPVEGEAEGEPPQPRRGQGHIERASRGETVRAVRDGDVHYDTCAGTPGVVYMRLGRICHRH